MVELYEDDEVEVYDKNGELRFCGLIESSSEWICDNPLVPEKVYVVAIDKTLSVDEFMKSVDDTLDY